MSRKGSNRSENLIGRTRKLINGYPKNSILKEFLQNADDAKATELIVTYDARIHTSLDNTDFSPAKGPALLICNDSKFEEKDFNAIIEIGAEGSKQDDPNSTGRFGEGFNSSFSISDHPSFISNGRAYWFDILREAVSKDAGSPDTPYWEEDDFDEIKDWLDVFTVGSEAYFNSYDTVFRLPLRNSKTESRISNEVFSRKDFLEWVDEWKTNASQLLFLRHIQRLVLQEISTNEHTTIHLDISTKNKSEILTINNSIQEKFIGSPLEICMDWKDTTEELPFFKYKHHFSIDYFDREKQCKESYKENWAVVNGLFRGENNNLINQAIKALEIRPEPRKVMPWAGVAIKLDNKGKPQKTENSQYFTFLPLPITSHNPVHIHGWFEINSERTQITCVESGEDLEILTEWNKLLFEQGVGVAWAYLIDYIKELCLANSYYTFWPKNNDDQFDTYLLTGFYNKISGLQCFKTSYKNSTQWNTPKDNIYYLQRGLDKNLFSAFREHFYLITQKPSQRIINGLVEAGVELQEIQPKFIREFLIEESEELDFPVSLNDVPIKMLSQKKWLLAILIFCAEAEEDADYSYLDELPLQIATDNKLYQLGDHCLVAEIPNFAIFNGNKALFLDADIVEIVKDAEYLPSSWYQPTLKNYLRVLHDYIDQYDLKDKKWLKNLVTLITKSDQSQIDEADEELHQLQVVHQHDSTFGFLESKVDSPVLVPKEEISNIPLLSKTGMSLVHSDYIDIYSPLSQLKDVDLITELSPFSLIKYLVQIPEEEYSFFEKRKLRGYLVDFIAQDISWFDELSENELECLNGMPFIVTESSNLYSKSDDKKLFLPAGFMPPENIQSLKGEYELIKVVDKKQQALYKKMGFEEQNPINYLEEIIIPFIESSPSVVDVKKILGWLSNEWEKLTDGITEEAKKELTKCLSDSKIILGFGNNLNTASNYYHPEFLSKLPTFLKNKQYSPLIFESDNTQQNWKKLLSLLGASQEIIPQHIVDIVESISEEKDHERSISLLNYMSNHFEWFDEMQYKSKPIFDHLSDFSWIPAEKPKEILRPCDEYKVLRKPSEIIQAKDYMIAGGCHYSLSSKVKFGKKDGNGEFSKRKMAEKIKLLVSLPTASVFKSFQRLRDIATNDQEKKISNYAKEFYKYIGRALSENEIPNDIKEKSIFIMGEWLSSNKVFQSPPDHLSGIYGWGDLVTNDGTESQLAKGLIKLGVSKRPDNNYLIDYLHNNIPKNEKLYGQQLKEAKAILNHFQGNLEDLDVDDIPLISHSDQLVDCNDLYIEDLPAYNNSEKKNDQLEFCQDKFKELAKHCNVVSLADSAIPQLDNEHSQEPESVDNSWNDYIRSEPFKLAILRLIYHERKISDDEIDNKSIEKVLPSKVLLMDRLVVNYYIDGVWIYDDVETSTYQDTENSILYLLNQEDEEDMCDSIAKFITESSKLSPDSLLLIARILRKKLKDLKEIQNLLDKQKIKSLPEKIEIDEDISLYGDNTESSNDLDDSTSHNENIDQDNPLSDDCNQENEQSPSDDDQNSEDNSPESNEPEKSDDEIPPPTKPKQSSSQDDAIDTSSGYQNPNTGNSDHNWHGHNATRGSSSGTRPKSTRNSVSPNNRMPVYVGKEKELDKERTEEEREYAKKIGGKGEQYVLDHSKEYLFSTSNRFVKAATDNNKGYDITEVDSNGEIVRYIEVKTLTGQWGEGGVGITESQLEFAQVYDNWWLFVVENINTENTQIHVLENPVLQANRFMFDHSWKQLAVETKGAKDINPQAGEKYLLPEGEYEILSVDPKGKFFKVILKHTQSNKEVTKKFDPSWEKC